MKTFFFSFLLLFAFECCLFSQDLAGRKILTANLSAKAAGTDSDLAVQINTGLLFGKIKADNTYWAYGGQLSYAGSNGENYVISVGPGIERGKFIKLFDKFYSAPYVGGSAQAVFGLTEGVVLNAYAVPLRFVYQFSENFLLSATFGSASLLYSRLDDVNLFLLNANWQNNSGFGVFYTFK